MYNFEDILSRKGNGSKKWSKEYIKKRFNIKEGEELYPLFIADMDFKLPKEITEPFNKLVSEADFGYFDVKDSFFDSVQEWYRDMYTTEIKREWIVPSIGALTSMNLIVEKLFNKGDKILIFTPVYGPFKDVIINNDMKLVSNKLSIDKDKYYIDFKELEKQIDTEQVKGIIFCNPHNPSGKCWSNEEVEKLIEISKARNITIISDEVHGDLVLGTNKFVSLSRYLTEYNKIIVISSPNKTFNIAGLNISTFLCSNDEVRCYLDKEFNKRKLHVNRLGCDMLTICYENGKEWTRCLRDNIKENIDLVTNILNVDGIKVMTPEAGYLLWIEIENVSDIDDFILQLAKNKKVLLETGNRFVLAEKGYFRFNVATSKEIIVEASNRIIEFYNEYTKEKLGEQ